MGQTSSGVEEQPGVSNELGDSQCSFCENPRCYVEIEDVAPPDRSLNDLADKFEGVVEKAKSLGLQELVEPIKDTAVTLKNLADGKQSVELNLPRLSCNCNQWGPDDVTTQGDWICNTCGDKCQCDKTWCIPPGGSRGMSPGSDPEALQEKYDGNLINQSIKEQSIEQIRADEIELPVQSQGTLSPPLRSHYLSEISQREAEILRGENERDQVVMEGEPTIARLSDVESIERQRSVGGQSVGEGAKCPCGCGYYQEGEFKVCPCGCGTIIEIVDDGESSEVRAGGPCCLCGPELQDELSNNNYPRELSRLSLVTNDTGLVTALEMLRAKCRIKDGIIAVLAEELRNSGNVDHIVDNLAAPCLPHIAIDFDRSMLCEYLSSRSLPDLTSGPREKQDDTVPGPSNFRVIRSILNSLFVAWDPPEFLCGIRGYEILVNGIVTCRVASPTRSQAILTSVDLTKPTVLTIYAVATNGHISESSTITFPAG